jgi:hypothetical protein
VPGIGAIRECQRGKTGAGEEAGEKKTDVILFHNVVIIWLCQRQIYKKTTAGQTRKRRRRKEDREKGKSESGRQKKRGYLFKR